MKVHILFEVDEIDRGAHRASITTGRIVGTWTNDLKARGAFAGRCVATGDRDARVEETETGFAFLPDFDTKIFLFLDVEVQS